MPLLINDPGIPPPPPPLARSRSASGIAIRQQLVRDLLLGRVDGRAGSHVTHGHFNAVFMPTMPRFSECSYVSENPPAVMSQKGSSR